MKSVIDTRCEARRLYTIAAGKYNVSLSFSPQDLSIMEAYAKCLCNILLMESETAPTSASEMWISPTLEEGKMRIVDAFDKLVNLRNTAAIAAILKEIPHEAIFA